MKKDTKLWSVEKLRQTVSSINFPEYQREPNIWSKSAKQRLIDSILREFDISSIYIYEGDDGILDCIDGRQRIGAILSFFCENPEDKDHNGFELNIDNEIFKEDSPRFVEMDGKTYAQIKAMTDEGHPKAAELIQLLDNYPMTVVTLSRSSRPEEFNLQFTRLNLGTIINSGEKLHAMVGDMRNICFDELGKHPFLAFTNIPTRRYAQEQVAAQILAQIFSYEGAGKWIRTRHFDLQKFFKDHAELNTDSQALVDRIREILDVLSPAFQDVNALRNRAITVSTVLLAWTEAIRSKDGAQQLAAFMTEFLCRLHWQVKKGLDIDNEYRYLIDFQRHVTQASVEARAVEERAGVLTEEFHRWREEGTLRGDRKFRKRTQEDPSEECRR